VTACGENRSGAGRKARDGPRRSRKKILPFRRPHDASFRNQQTFQNGFGNLAEIKAQIEGLKAHKAELGADP